MSDVKRCGRCLEVKPVSEFNRNKATRDGLQATCRSCMRLYQAAHYLKNRTSHVSRVREDNVRRKALAAAHLKRYLEVHPCVDCGTDDLRVLEFDHRAGEVKAASISFMVGTGLPWERILSEIA